jgi:hypothetical protein
MHRSVNYEAMMAVACSPEELNPPLDYVTFALMYQYWAIMKFSQTRPPKEKGIGF